MSNPYKPQTGRFSFRKYVFNGALVAIGIVGTTLVTSLSKGIADEIGIQWSQMTGSHPVLVLVSSNGGATQVENAEVRVVSALQDEKALTGRSDEYGRASFKDVSTSDFLLTVTSTKDGTTTQCKLYSKADKYPFTVQVKLDACRQLKDEATSSEIAGATVPWLKLALGEVGVTEWKGQVSNPRINKYFAAVGWPLDQWQPWGCAFIGWTLKNSSIELPKEAASCVSYVMNYGTQLRQPKVGALGFLRPDGIDEARTGLVGIVSEINAAGVTMIVGNVNNSVTRVTYQPDEVAFVWPPQTSN